MPSASAISNNFLIEIDGINVPKHRILNLVLSNNEELKLGISRNVKEGIIPINGLRLYPEEGTSGWFIWAGEEFSEDPDFFVPLHIEHIDEWAPNVKQYLGLAPGWRFLIAGDYEDVWFDKQILNDF